MTSSHESLERLDAWYANKVKDKYTSEVAHTATELFLTDIGRSEDLDLTRIVHDVTVELLSRERQVQTAQTYFTQAFSTIERIQETFRSEELEVKGISAGVKEEYLDPLLERMVQMQQFIARVRDMAAQDFPKGIADNEMDKAFLDVFGGHEGFSEFTSTYSNAGLLFMDLLVQKGLMLQEGFNNVEVVLRAANKRAIPYINSIIFGNLRKQ